MKLIFAIVALVFSASVFAQDKSAQTRRCMVYGDLIEALHIIRAADKSTTASSFYESYSSIAKKKLDSGEIDKDEHDFRIARTLKVITYVFSTPNFYTPQEMNTRGFRDCINGEFD